MAITAGMVKELREMTGAGMMDCKKALDRGRRRAWKRLLSCLREKGLAASAKKAGRIASEGMVAVYLSDDNKIGAIVEVNSETDFVAKNAGIQRLCCSSCKTGFRNNSSRYGRFL